MAKKTLTYICNNCGNKTPKWLGKCDNCNEWNTIEQYITPTSSVLTSHTNKKLSKEEDLAINKITFADMHAESEVLPRFSTGLSEFDRVCGGEGLVQGSAVLLGGDPGIGKSTLLMQTIANLSLQRNCIYISGEESVDQIKRRALRLNINYNNLKISNSTNLVDILHTLNDIANLDVLVIDSIQTMYLDSVGSIAGSINQVKACSNELINFCKAKNIVLLIIGHVTKEGTIAGPRILEHMVDCVLHFEGEKNNNFRILRALKNRFGPTDELGIFEMTQEGLSEVANPSQLFLQDYIENVSGSTIYAGLEGMRPILVEVQSLLVNSFYPSPKRATVGADYNRVAMLTAVLEAKAGINVANKDIYLNIVGGLKITDPALDLAIVASLVSSYLNKPLNNSCIFVGEISLSGHIKNVYFLHKRLQEASRLGFKVAYIPNVGKKQLNTLQAEAPNINLICVDSVYSLINIIKNN